MDIDACNYLDMTDNDYDDDINKTDTDDDNMNDKLRHLKLLLLKGLVPLAEDEIVVNLSDECFILINSQLRKERFPNLK